MAFFLQHIGVEGHLPVPWISDEGEGKIGPEPGLADFLHELRSRNMMLVNLIAERRMPERHRDFSAETHPPVGTERLQRLPDARSPGFVHMDENELPLMRDHYDYILTYSEGI